MRRRLPLVLGLALVACGKEPTVVPGLTVAENVLLGCFL